MDTIETSMPVASGTDASESQVPDKEEIRGILEANHLGDITGIGVTALPGLSELLDELPAKMRIKAVRAIDEVAKANPTNPKLATVVPALDKARNAWADVDGNAAWWAADTLQKIVSFNPEAMDALLPLLVEDLKDESCRTGTIEMVGAIAQLNTRNVKIIRVVPALAEGPNYDLDNLWRVAETLEKIIIAHAGKGELENVNHNIIPVLIEAWKCGTSIVRATVMHALHVLLTTTTISPDRLDLTLIQTSLADYVSYVRENHSPEDSITAQKEAAELYLKIASAVSSCASESREMKRGFLDAKPMPPKGRGNGMLRYQSGRQEMARVATGRMQRTQMHEGRRAVLI